jgi:hypothetical protein
MKARPYLKPFLLLLALVAFAVSPNKASAADDEYSFKVENKTKVKITKILVSVDKKTWGHFDIGKGIPAGETVKLVWSKETDDEPCKQWVKAVYADDEEAEAAKFDFCEADLEIVFE